MFSIATINIEDRQKGRMMASSIIDCDSSKSSIDDAFKTLYQKEFISRLKNTKNPYREGGASKKIKDINLDGIIKKSFYDIRVNK